jgi:hypothetical protein
LVVVHFGVTYLHGGRDKCRIGVAATKLIGRWEYPQACASLSARRKGGRSLAKKFTNLNAPAAFGWLDLQEVSQSCPAETLFESHQREVSVSDAHMPIAGLRLMRVALMIRE